MSLKNSFKVIEFEPKKQILSDILNDMSLKKIIPESIGL